MSKTFWGLWNDGEQTWVVVPSGEMLFYPTPAVAHAAYISSFHWLDPDSVAVRQMGDDGYPLTTTGKAEMVATQAELEAVAVDFTKLPHLVRVKICDDLRASGLHGLADVLWRAVDKARQSLATS